MMMLLMRFSKIIGLFGLGLLIGAASAQSTTVSIEVVDLGGQSWTNGTISYVFRPAPGYGGQYQWNGSALPSQYLVPTIVNLDSNGDATFTVPSNSSITPAQSSWTFTVCPNATAPCAIISIFIAGATQDISSTINPILNSLVIGVQPFPMAYNTSEIKTIPAQGGIMFNTTAKQPEYFDGTTWHFFGESSSGAIYGFTMVLTTATVDSYTIPTGFTPANCTFSPTIGSLVAADVLNMYYTITGQTFHLYHTATIDNTGSVGVLCQVGLGE